MKQSVAQIQREVSERTDVLYALDRICQVCGTVIETREGAAHTRAADGSEFLTHQSNECTSGMLLELIRRSGFGRRGSLRLMR